MAVATDLAMALDPAALARQAGLDPDPWQERVLRSESPRLLLNCSRQSGKSVTTGVLAVHTALYQPESLVLLLSPSLRQSGELFRKAIAVYRSVGEIEPPEAESALRLELANGSRIISLPGSEATIRGYSGVRLLIVDEAARIDESLIAAVRPMLAVSRGRLVALSTPWGKRGWFWRAWTDGDGWERVKVPATDCPRISAAFLEEERRALTPLEFASEYECSFVESEGSLFAGEDIRAMADDATIRPLFGGASWLGSQ